MAGVVTAPDRLQAIQMLTHRGTFVTDIHACDNDGSQRNDGVAGQAGGDIDFSMLKFRGGMSGRHRVSVFRQLAVALQAGLPLLNALEIVRDQGDSPAVERVLDDLIKRVHGGEPLSSAMEQHRREFTLMQVSMVRAGETAGVLDHVMQSLAEFAERDQAVREKLRSAALYPMMVMGLGVISIVVILTFILPRIMATVTTTVEALPMPTRVLLAMSEAFKSPIGWAMMLGVVGGLGWFWYWKRTTEGRLFVDGVKLRLPIIGTAVTRVAVARFARTLGTLSAAGIQVVEAMRIVRDTLGNEVLGREIDQAADEILRGQSIADPLRASGRFPELLIQVIAMGERTGKLDTLLTQTADTYERETEVALERVMSVIPVLFILVLALFVAFVLAAALLPVMTMELS